MPDLASTNPRIWQHFHANKKFRVECIAVNRGDFQFPGKIRRYRFPFDPLFCENDGILFGQAADETPSTTPDTQTTGLFQSVGTVLLIDPGNASSGTDQHRSP
ncbi:hypothetical protein [Gluconacetobacter tumulisoli]|uniref:Uncharacterized protein n=1 Tax=Gluconacetobacter tumulisoli TaxID=1286189 RepID=A0A7W4PN60_9PROT|nr:hypothetical protein [Gluconacetobacter tumulisoli]MBB2202329.1 hypothetical protein [Gluconacetobacter tumulisoli]